MPTWFATSTSRQAEVTARQISMAGHLYGRSRSYGNKLSGSCRTAGTVGGWLSAARGQDAGARVRSSQAGRSRWCADELPDPAHAASGFLGVIAELLGHPADAASNAEPADGGADPARQIVGCRRIRSSQPRREECCAPRVVYIQPGHVKPPRFHVWHGGNRHRAVQRSSSNRALGD